MTATLHERLPVATCIACGARSRAGDCPDGCTDVALDLVEVRDVEAATERLRAIRARVEALREVVRDAATGSEPAALRERARTALGLPLGPQPDPPEIVLAWGCPTCGRIDAPQPCLGVCVRRPVLMADAREYRDLAAAAEREALAARELTAVATLVAHVRPRPGHEQATAAAVQTRARRTLEAVSR